MADEPERHHPSLELPSFFSRKRRARPTAVELVGPPRSRPPARLAAVITGAMIGLATAGLIWLALRGCSGIRGTSSCGDPGVLVLLAIFVAMILAGRALLTALGVPESGSTAFLGVALVALVAMMFVPAVSPMGAAVLTAVGAAMFAVAHWVTSRFTEPGERAR